MRLAIPPVTAGLPAPPRRASSGRPGRPGRPGPGRVLLVLAALALPALSVEPPAADAAGAAARGGARHLTTFYTAEIHGTLEPCGCTSDPLGDIARYATVVRAARAKGNDVLLVDGGGLSYREGGISAKEREGDALRAAFLATELGKLGLRAAGLAETDLGAGGSAKGLAPRRLAVNLAPPPGLATPALAPSVLETAGGVKVGIFGVADPALGAPLGLRSEDPVAAGKREAQRLRQAGAELVVALAPVDRATARRLAREAAVDFVVLARQVGHGAPRAEAVGRAFLLAPADEMQKVGRLDVTLRTAGPLVDAGGPEALALRKTEVQQTLARLDGDLAGWAKATGGSADATFLASKRRERDALADELKGLSAGAWKAPETGNVFTNALVPLSRSLPRDPTLAAAMHRLDARIGKANLREAAPPVPPEAGRPFYVGMAKCAPCHKSATAFWQKTVHAQAWKTLVDGGKDADYKCVGCHVSGYGEVGGTSLGHTQGYQNVQCETCHGPGSVHVAAKGLEDPPAIQRQAPASTCTACHNEHHSDTFVYDAYLRDVLGPGHGASARERLGDGATGHTLRQAALAKAKAAGAAAAQKL
jgi:hypothetical protein